MHTPIPELVQQKLEAFERIQREFEESFHFVQRVQGQQRYAVFPPNHTVRYIHSLWMCERKDRLLSVYRNIERYEGRYCLELLRRWQDSGESADVVDFLSRKLDMLPLGDITRQIEQARLNAGETEGGLTRRLIEGREVLLNRGMSLMQALDGLFSIPEETLLNEVRVACEQFGHHPDQIQRQLAEIDSPLYAYVPHQLLAQRNMALMNKLGVHVMNRPSDQPGERSWRVLEPTVPHGPFAEHVIAGYVELTLPGHNNPKDLRFVDMPERSKEGTI